MHVYVYVQTRVCIQGLAHGLVLVVAYGVAYSSSIIYVCFVAATTQQYACRCAIFCVQFSVVCTQVCQQQQDLIRSRFVLATLQHNATHCKTLQYSAIHCNTLQHQ